MFCSFTTTDSRSCSTFSCSRLDANEQTNQFALAPRRMILSLTLLHNVHLESCNVTYKCFLSPFPAADALVELLAVPFEVLVVAE
jgi:hypothetical protein